MGRLLHWLHPNTMYLRSILVIFLLTQQTNKKPTALSRWKEEKVPSISQVFFDDSDFTLTQDYPVSTKQTPTEHQELKTEMISWPLPSRISFSQWQVGGNVPEKGHKTMGQVYAMGAGDTTKRGGDPGHSWRTPAARRMPQQVRSVFEGQRAGGKGWRGAGMQPSATQV